MKIRQTKEIVEKILNEKPETRDSDALLFIEVIRSIDPEAVNLPIYKLMPRCTDEGDLPPFETMRRTRQKIQEQNPNLRGSKEVESYRAYKEHKFFDFAISRK